jgi:putative ABC transport system permease protein
MSLAPLWQASRTLPNEVLTDGVRAAAGARSRKLSRSLVVAEIGLAFTLLAAGVILIAHLGKLRRVAPGFQPGNLLTFQLTLPDTIASTGEKRVPHQIGITERLNTVPGVTGVGFVNQLPLAGCCMSTQIFPEGRPTVANEMYSVGFLPVNPDYFDALRLPLRKGRLLTYHDNNDDFLSAVVNEAAVRHYWPDRDPVGAWSRLASPTGSRFQVVGVVGDVRNKGLNNPPVPEIYLLSVPIAVNPMQFVVRSQLPPQTLVPEIRRAIQQIDPTQPIHDIATMDDILLKSLTLERAGSYIMTFFAFAALVLATLGIYGEVWYSVRQRTVEMGTRMALGAVTRSAGPRRR